MSVHVRLTQGPLADATQTRVVNGSGAKIVFDGIVRPMEDEAEIVGLDYEAYRPMAEQQLERIGIQLLEKHGLLAMDIEHSVAPAVYETGVKNTHEPGKAD